MIVIFLFVLKPKESVITYDVCNPNPCQSNGKCSKAGEKYACDCDRTGHRGEYCEKDIDECEDEDQPCKNGGNCINIIGKYICHCQDGWEGDYCSIPQTKFGML